MENGMSCWHVEEAAFGKDAPVMDLGLQLVIGNQ
jgi:hypothetical protein